MAIEKNESITDSGLKSGIQQGVKDDLTVPSHGDPKAEAEVEPQEGTTKAWLSLTGASLAMFVSFGWVNCIALFQAEYERNQLKQYSQSTVSWITSMEFFFMLFMSPVSGWMFDNYGPHPPIFIGSILHVLGLMMASLSSKYYQFALSQSVCSGIGASLIFTPSMTSPMTYFKKNRAIAGGLTIAGSSLGGVIFPLMVSHMMPEVGFRWALRVCAFLILFLLIIANLTISSNLKHGKKPFNITNFTHPLKDFGFIILCIGSFFLYWGMFVPFNYIVTAGIRYGMNPSDAFNLIPIMNGASFLGRTVPNVLADRYGRFNVIIIMMLYTMVIILALWLPGRGNGPSVAFAVLFGIGSGASIGLGPVIIMAISPLNEVGYRMGTVFSIAGIGCLTSPPIAGAIVEATKDGIYDYSCVFSGVAYFVSLIFIIWLRGVVVGWSPTIKG